MTDTPRDEPLRDDETANEATAAEPTGGDAPAGSEIEQLREESARRLAAWQRAQADYENLKRRTAQDVRAQVERSQERIFNSLMDLVDDFRRALKEETGGADDLREGVALIEKKLIAVLGRSNIHPIEAVGVPFDTDFHESISEQPGPKGQVIAEIQGGWLSGERVLRASKVVVGTGQPDELGQQNTEQRNAERAAPGELNAGAAEGAES